MFLGLSIHAWITVATIIAIFSVLLLTQLPADLVFLTGIATLFLTGVLDEKEVLSGFSSSTVIVIGLLFVVVAGLVHTGVLKLIVKHTLGHPRTYPGAITKIMAITAALSAFLNNTLVVALLVKVVKMWSRKLGQAASKLLIPLSYAAGMGGVCTLIGTPPNMIISEMLKQETGTQIGFFATTLPGLFCLAVGIGVTILLRRLLPERKSNDATLENVSDYTVEFLVPTDNEHVGQTVEESGLDRIQNGRLLQIVRFDKETVTAVSPQEFIFGGDRLIFSGDIDELLEIKQRYNLAATTEHLFHYESENNQDNTIHTAYVPYRSSLIGRNIIETGLENKYGFVLAAVARNGEVIKSSPRELTLEAGDSLLLMTGKTNKLNGLEKVLHFFDSDNISKPSRKAVVSSVIMMALVCLTAFNVLTLLQASIASCLAMLVTRCCSFSQAKDSIEWNILMIFAASIAIGTAISKTGIAEAMSDGILNICGPHPLLVLTMLCFLGTFITEFISNTACAAIFFPVAYHSAIALGSNPITFCIALMIAVSSSFATPIGSPTHMLVYGPGGYNFKDFMKIGLPMNLIILAANIFITTTVYPL